MTIITPIGFVDTMDQMAFSEAKYQNKKRKTRFEAFRRRMNKLIPCKQLESEYSSSVMIK